MQQILITYSNIFINSMNKHMKNSMSTPLIVCNGVNTGNQNLKEVNLVDKDRNKGKLNNQKSYKQIYSKPVTLNAKTNNQGSKKRKKGRGFPSQPQVQPVKTKKLISGSNSSFSNTKKKISTARFSPADLMGANSGKY